MDIFTVTFYQFCLNYNMYNHVIPYQIYDYVLLIYKFLVAGVNNFRKDIEMMLGKQNIILMSYWYCTWMFVTPVAITVSYETCVCMVSF